MHNPVTMGALHACRFEPYLQNLLSPALQRREWILNKVESVGTVEIGFTDKFDRFTVKTQLHALAGLSEILYDENYRMSLRDIATDLLPHHAQHIAIPYRPSAHFTWNTTVVIDLSKALFRRNEERRDCTVANSSQLGACFTRFLFCFLFSTSLAALRRHIEKPLDYRTQYHADGSIE